MTFQPDAGRLVDAVIPARWFTATNGRNHRVVVWHTMESPEKPTTAEDVSRWAQTLPADRKASWTYAVDSDSIVQCVRERDVAYAAPGANHDGIQVELAGRAGQGKAGWADAYSRAVLANAARLGANISIRRDIPMQWLSVKDLLAGKSGHTSHNNVSLAYRRSDHHDPGPTFPAAWFVDEIRRQAKLQTGAAPLAKGPLTFRAAGGTVVLFTGYLNNPATVSRLVSVLRSAGGRKPWRATIGGREIGRGALWGIAEPSAFNVLVARAARQGNAVTINNTVTITKE